MKRKYLVYMVGILVLAVVFFGLSRFLKNRDNVLGKIGGKKILVDPGNISENKRVQSNEEQELRLPEKIDPDEPEQGLDEIEQADLTEKCEKGQWAELLAGSTGQQTKTGVLESTESGEGQDSDIASYVYELNGQRVISENLDALDFFTDRQVEISGEESGENFSVQKIRCIGQETDQKIISLRAQVMDYIDENINNLSSQKGDWVVESFFWPDNKHVYAEYSAYIEDDEVIEQGQDDNVYAILLEVPENFNANTGLSQKALLKLGEEDWEVISGDNPFEDFEDQSQYYEFNYQLNRWAKTSF